MKLRLAAFAAVAAVSCHARRPDVLRVTLHTPEGTAQGIDEVLTLGFDRPVGPGDVSLRFDPPVEGTAHWVDARTLTFAPRSHWPVGTRVKARIDRGVRALDGAELPAEVSWSFDTPRAELYGVRLGGRHLYGGDWELRWIDPQPEFQLDWTLERSAAEVAKQCRILVGDQPIAVAARPDSGTTIYLSPKRALERGSDGKLECERSKRMADGHLGNHELAFHVRGDFQMIGHEPGHDGVPADDVHVRLDFTNPVDADDVKKAVTIDPRPGELRAHGGWDGQVTLEGEFTPGEVYHVTVKRTLRDRFAQKLDSDYHFRFQTGDERPMLSMQRGLYVVEASSPLYPLWTRNLSHIDLVKARIPESKLVPTLDRIQLHGNENTKLDVRTEEKRLRAGGRRNHWNEGIVDLERPGVYFLDGISGDVHHKVIANVTDLGLTAKLAPAQGLVWVTSLATGKPVAGAQVVIRDRKNQVRFRGVTDGSGLCTTPGRDKLGAPKPLDPNVDESEFEEERFWNDGGDETGELFVIVKSGDDLAFLGDRWQPGTASWSYGIKPDHTPGATRIRGFLETDRGLYRPGDTVHVKGIVRAARTGEPLRVLLREKVALRVTDPRGDRVLEKTVDTGAFGGFAFDIPTAKEARLGDWRIEARVRDQRFEIGYSVEEYRPATFQVELAAKKPTYTVGETLVARVRAGYFYGAPLRGAKVRYSVRRRERFQGFGGDLEPFTFYDRVALEDQGYYRFDDSSRSELLHEDEGATGEDGTFEIKVPLQADSAAPQDFLVEAEVSDETGQARSAHLVLPTHRSAMYLGVHTDWLAPIGKPFPVLLVATDTAGKRVAASGVDVDVKLRRWDCSGHRCEASDQTLTTRTVDIAATGGPASMTFTVNHPGEITIVAHGKDVRGREVRASSYLYAWGAGDVSWRTDDSTHLPLVPDKTSYKPGETARVLVQAPFAGTALVTTERQGVLGKRIVEFKSAAETVEVPIGERDLPNIYLSVAMVRGRTGKGDGGRPQFKLGLATLKVLPDAKKLAITALPDRPVYRPGDKVKVALAVRDAAGQPVRAELALAAADEGVLSLVAYKTPDPLAVFYAPWGLGVETATSYERFAHRVDPTEDDEGGVGDGGDAESATRIRSKFLPTAFWNPQVRTDASGRATVEFTAPDQLTAFRVMVVAADAGDHFGSAEVQFRVAKPFALHPVVPRFLTVGDAARVGVVVQNDTEDAGQVTVVADGVRGEHKKTVKVPRHARVPVLFDAKAEQVGNASFRFRAALGKEKDGVEVTIPIERPAPMETLTLAEGSTKAAATAQVAAPASAVPNEGELDVTLDGSGLAGASEGLRYLVEYPYGCLEQTTTKVVPLVALNDLAESMDLDDLKGTRLREYVAAGVAKILRHQADSGGFSLWPGGKPESYLTAFALYGLHQARQAGFAVPDEPVDRGLRYLRAAVASGQFSNPYHQEIMGEAGSHAFALYVLSVWGRPDPGLLGKLFLDRDKLPRYGKAFLARAMALSGTNAEAVKMLVAEITADPVKKGDGVIVPEPAGDRLAFWFSDDTRTSAMALQALLEVAPDHPLVDPLVRGLLASRRDGRWGSTQSNFFGLTAIAMYAHRRAVADVPVDVAIGDHELFRGRIGGRQLRRLTLPLGSAHGELRVKADGPSVFYAARVRYAPRPETLSPLAKGFDLRREVVDAQTGAPLSSIQVGQVVRVKLTAVAPEARTRVALVDRLPAGLEIVDAKSGQSWLWNYVEAHDDRVEIFSEWMWGGAHTYEYLARATTAGTFTRPPATIEEMYRPEHRARTALETVEVRP